MLQQACCSEHQDNPATRSCRRCGNYLCENCETEWGDRILCLRCAEKFYEEESVDRFRMCMDQKWPARWSIIFAVIGWLFFPLTLLILMAALAKGGNRQEELMGAAMFGMWAGSLGAMGMGHGITAIRLRGNHMFMGTIGFLASSALVGVELSIYLTIFMQRFLGQFQPL